MVLKFKSPYPDDETRTKKASKVIEEWLKDTWDLADINVNDIGFGIPLNLMDQSGKDIILKVTTFHNSTERWIYGGGRYRFTDNMLLDCYVVDREANIGGEDPRAVLIQKYLDEKLAINQSESFRGIHTIEIRGSTITPDDVRNDLSRVMIRMDVVYLADIVDV
jgi:hypothetical protein